MKKTAYCLLISLVFLNCRNSTEEKPLPNTEAITAPPLNERDGGDAAEENGFTINPVEHASMVINWEGTIIYVDPVGGTKAFGDYTPPDLILITDIHQDHFDVATLESVATDNTKLIVPQAVADRLSSTLLKKSQIQNNGDSKTSIGIEIRAIPMYNLRKEALQYHPKGRGNGYVLEKKGKRIYISGDTEDTPEMRNLKNIDIAFVCMNLPYTMPVEKAAEAVLAFKPKTVYPYHYRGTNGLSDVAKFKKLVEDGNPNIKVTQLDWYPNE